MSFRNPHDERLGDGTLTDSRVAHSYRRGLSGPLRFAPRFPVRFQHPQLYDADGNYIYEPDDDIGGAGHYLEQARLRRNGNGCEP